MEITEVRIKLMEDSEDRLRAFCSVTFDQSFVVRDLKIIEGTSGPFVAMPSRKLTGRCNRCGYKNHLRSNFCNQCGTRLRGGHDLRDQESGSNRLYADIAHPINQHCRDLIQKEVISEYVLEVERAKLPGYQSRYDDDYFESVSVIEPAVEPLSRTTSAPSPAPSSEAASSPSVVPTPHFDLTKGLPEHATVGESQPQSPSLGMSIEESQSPRTTSDSFGKGILGPDSPPSP